MTGLPEIYVFKKPALVLSPVQVFAFSFPIGFMVKAFFGILDNHKYYKYYKNYIGVIMNIYTAKRLLKENGLSVVKNNSSMQFAVAVNKRLYQITMEDDWQDALCNTIKDKLITYVDYEHWDGAKNMIDDIRAITDGDYRLLTLNPDTGKWEDQ